MPLYNFFKHSLLNALVEIANKMGLQNKMYSLPLFGICIQLLTLTFVWIPELSPASATSFS
jgi:hypothetical protein